ncbi:MAG: hypothetical protein IK062_06690 [Selenomonadaceae bacterium]|nr:hypothetical protein [Selenomonadaceae bacterium]
MSEQILIRNKIERDLLFSSDDAWNAFQELRKQSADVPEMSLEEINAEIASVRAEKKNRT